MYNSEIRQMLTLGAETRSESKKKFTQVMEMRILRRGVESEIKYIFWWKNTHGERMMK